MPIIEDRIRSRRDKFGRKRDPVQQRGRQKREEILRATALLLDKVGFDDLTTILIARELGISVGSLYHYFPNKQAILHALGEQWLEEYSRALDDIAALPLESFSRREFSERSLQRLLQVYREQKGVLPLVQAMYSVPELRELDDEHDQLVISTMVLMFRRLGLEGRAPELKRLGRLWLELTHALLLTTAQQGAGRAGRSLEDLVALCAHLLERH